MESFPIQNGLKPIKPDTRTYSFPRTFGAVSPVVFPDSYSCDPELTMPDQNEDGYPQGCTWYTQTELCNDEDNCKYNVLFTRKNTLYIENQLDGPCNIQDALKATIVYGVQKEGEEEVQALSHRRGQYFSVEKTGGLDWFDSLRSALWLNRMNRRSLSVGTPWFTEWHSPQSGIVSEQITYSGNPNDYPWHNWKIAGWKTINGQPYLLGKTWQGPNYGDEGWAYFSRIVINKIFSIFGSGAFTIAQIDPSNIQNVRLSMLQVLLSYYYRLAGYYARLIAGGSPLESSQTPKMPSSDPLPLKPITTMLDKFCTAIRDFEGKPGDLNYRNNNPGNYRFSPVGYLPKYGRVTNINGFAHFPTYQLGWEYHEASVMHWAHLHPNWTILDFFRHYAPPSDNNPTNIYAENVAAHCGVPVSTTLRELFA